jgi:hypothetical protein
MKKKKREGRRLGLNLGVVPNMGGFEVVVTDGVDRNLLEVLGFLSGFVSLPLAFFLSLVFFFFPLFSFILFPSYSSSPL